MGCELRLEDLRILGFCGHNHIMRRHENIAWDIIVVVQIRHYLLAVQAGVLFELALVKEYLAYVQKYLVQLLTLLPAERDDAVQEVELKLLVDV